MDSIMHLLDEMEGYLQECNNLPFSNKVVVNMEVLYEFMTDLRMKLPEEIKRSKRIIDERDKIIETAKAQALESESEAKRRVKELLDEHEIRKQAIAEAEVLLGKAKDSAEEITDGAYNYVDELLAQSQQVFKDTLIKTNNQYMQFESYMKKQLDVIERNREEIKK